MLEKSGEFQQLRVTELGQQVLRREVTPILLRHAVDAGPTEMQSTSKSIADSWEGVDRISSMN